MPAIKFDTKHKTKGWAFIFLHADDAYFRQDHVVLVTHRMMDLLRKEGIPFNLVNPDWETAAKFTQKSRKKSAR